MHSFRLPIFCIFSTAFATAQTTDSFSEEHPHNDPVHLESFMVTASPYARHQADLAQPTSALANRELLLNQSNSLGELLSSQPGVSSTYFGPGASRPIIRGLGGDRVRILTDGVGTMDASVISPDHAVSIDPMLIERVEVVRGPATLLYGGNAVGGVVNVIDHRIHSTRPEDVFNARIEARAATVNGEESGGAVFEGGNGPLAWHVDAYRRNAGNVRIPGFAESAERRSHEAAEAEEHGESPPEEISGYIPNTALTAEGGSIGFSLIGQPGYIGFAYSGHDSDYGVPANAHGHADDTHEDGNESAFDEEAPVRIQLEQRRIDVQGAVTHPFGIFREARFKLGRAQYEHTEWEGDERGTVFHNDGFDGRVELLQAEKGRFTGIVGLDAGRSDFEAIGPEAFLPPSRTDRHALFILEEAQFNPVSWQLGARLEGQAISLRNDSGVEREDQMMSFSAGAVWPMNETWTLGLSLAHGERAPNTQELFANGPHLGTNAYEIGDPNLDVEKSLALDLTLRRRVGFTTGSLTLFANRFDDYIYERPTGQIADGLPVFQFVQHGAEFYGTELETIFHLHHTKKQQLDLIVAADLVRAKNSDDNSPLPRITPGRLRTGLAWTNGLWSVGTEVQIVARQERVAEAETPTPGYDLISAYASYRLTFDQIIFDLYMRATNLGDEEARMHTSFLKDVAPLPGRSVTVGLRASF